MALDLAQVQVVDPVRHVAYTNRREGRCIRTVEACTDLVRSHPNHQGNRRKTRGAGSLQSSQDFVLFLLSQQCPDNVHPLRHGAGLPGKPK